ncbi:MAG: class I SAM-dependent RNA methyltransferase [Dehalococcoidia bacterium]
MTIEAISISGQRGRRRKNRPVDRPRTPIEVELTGFAAGGRALGRAPDGRVAFVEFAIPGERVIAEITREEPSYVEASTVMVLEAAPSRVEPRCEYFGRCGGCQLQHIDYEAQLTLKTDLVRDQLRRIGGFEDPPVLGALGMGDPWGYRNHMRFTVRRDGQVGFMQRGTHRFLRIDHCDIAHPKVNEVLRHVQDRTMQTAQLSVRVGEHTGDVLVQPKLRWRPSRGAPLASGQQHYTEQLRDVTYRVSSPAFFQVNTRQAEVLVDLVVSRVVEARPRVAVDAYAGVGTFAAMLADHVDRVVTIEWSAAAGDDGEVNLARFPNVTRLVGSVEDVLPTLDPGPDVVVVDPPRIGLQRSVVDTILASKTRRLVYVSCDPSTLSRDLRLFVDGGLDLVEVQPLDMFPHTQHIECVTVLDRHAD